MSGKGSHGGEDQLLDERMKLLEQDRKSYFESSQLQLRQNRELIQELRKEHKELKTIVAAAKKGPGNLQEAEAAHLDRSIHMATLQLDRLRGEEQEKKMQIRALGATIEDIDVQSRPLLTEESLTTRKIRMLENRLDKSLIKFNEALSIKRTYEEIVRRLKEERVGFDNQLAAIERTLRAKDHDYQELLKMSHAANHAKELAKRELQQFKLAFDEERKQKDRELADRKAYVQAKVDQTQKLEKREKQLRLDEADEARRRLDEESQRRTGGTLALGSRPSERSAEEDDRLSQYEQAFRQIRDATGVADVHEVLQRFIVHEETQRNLETMAKEAQSRIKQLKAEKTELHQKLEELRYSGSGQLGSRRILEEFEVHLAEAENQARLQRERYEGLTLLLINIKAGIEHLVDQLAGFRTDMVVPPTTTDENVIDTLKVCEQKLIALSDDISPADLAVVDPATDTAGMRDMPQYNRRIRIPKDDDVDEEEEAAASPVDEGDDDAVLKREQVKKISVNAIQREAKKNKRKKKDRV